MKTYQIIESPFVAPVDLQTLNTAYNNLQTRHDEAIKATSELKTAVANLDLNEAEESFRNKLISDIEYMIDSNTAYGNSASAHDDIMKLSGDIASNPQLISKLKAQQEYKNFMTDLEARTDLSEHYKEYYRKINPYKEGVYDENGNWIKGTKWEPTKRAALNIDKTVIMDAALKYVTPNRGNYSVTTWMDKDGRLTKNYVEGAKMVRYNTQTYQYEQLTEKEIKDALTSVIRANPQYMDSLRQDYDIAVDDFENGRDSAFNVNNGTGKPISFETFVDNIFAPMIKSKAYSYTTLSKEDFNDKAYKELQAIGISNPVLDLTKTKGYSMPGENSKYLDNSYVLSTMNVSKGNNDIKNYLKGIEGVSDEFINSTDLSNPNAFNQALDSLNIDSAQKDIIRENYNTTRAKYAEDLHNKSKFDELYGNSKGGAAKKTLTYIVSGQLPAEEDMNKYEKQFNNSWNRLNKFYFPKGTQSIVIATPNKATYNEFVRLVEKSKLSDYFKLGIDKKGRYTIELDRSNNSKLFELSNLYQQAREVGKKGKPIKHFLNEVMSDIGLGESIYRVKEDGTKYNLLNRFSEAASRGLGNNVIGHVFSSIGDAFFTSPISEARHISQNTAGRIFDFVPGVNDARKFLQFGVIPDVGNILEPITNYRDRLANISSRNDFGEEKLVSNTSFRGATPEAIKAQARLDNGDYEDSTERNMLQNVVKDSNKSTFEYIQMQSIRNADIEMLDDKGNFEEVHDVSDIEKLEKELRSAKSSDANSLVNIEYHKGKGRYGRTIQFVDSDDKIIKLWVDYDNVNELTDLNKDPYLKSLRKFEEAQITDNDVRLGSYNGIDIYAIPIGDGIFGISADNSSSTFNTFNSSEKTFELLRIVKEQEENILMYSELLKNSDTIDDETLNYLSNYVNEYISNLLSVMNIDPKDENARNIMYNDIARDTGFNFR